MDIRQPPSTPSTMSLGWTAVHSLIYVSPLQGSKLYSTLTQGGAVPDGPACPGLVCLAPSGHLQLCICRRR
ncbi:MAG: hypothetical protein BWX73_03014 [Lentisphaerae bacterium ADurb.Bin082]|nr:MAG: hypothetical protein BWX73_03014 [Lentisphaerae bacterium ADurb.Bin082]